MIARTKRAVLLHLQAVNMVHHHSNTVDLLNKAATHHNSNTGLHHLKAADTASNLEVTHHNKVDILLSSNHQAMEEDTHLKVALPDRPAIRWRS
jgi:hypothetical protein